MQAYYRREKPNRKRTSPMSKLSPDLLSEHEALSSWSEKNSAARVFIFFGAENRSRSLLQANLVTFEVSLDNGAAVTVSLETHSQTRRVIRIIVYAYHPEYLYRNPSMEVGKDYDLALGLTAVLGNVKEFRYGHFERRAEWLAKLGIRGRLPGDNALHDAIQILLAERRSSMTSSFDTLPQSILRWVIDDMKLSDIDEVMKLVPEGMTLVAFIHKRMVTKGGYARAEKQRAMGLNGLEKARQAKRARPSKLQKQQMESGITKPSTVRVRCRKCKSVASEFDDTSPTWEISSGRYISRKRESCPTRGCCDLYKTRKGGSRRKQVNFVPVDTSIKFVHANNVTGKL